MSGLQTDVLKQKTIATGLAEVQLTHMSWEQYFNILPRERAFQIVEEYNMQVGYEPADMSAPENTDATYERKAALVEELENPSAKIKEQLLAQLKEGGVEVESFGKDLQDAVEEATLRAVENFGLPTALVKLEENTYLLATMSSDDVCVKMVNPIQGTVLLYRPRTFVLFSIKGE